MAIIGSFIRTADGFAGTFATLSLNTKITLRAIDREHDKSPDYRIMAGTREIGAAWAKTSASDRDYLSCKIDDPSLPAPLYVSLHSSEGSESFSLIWSR